MLKDALKTLNQPQTLSEAGMGAKEQGLFESLNQSLQAAALSIKERLAQELAIIAEQLVQQYVSQNKPRDGRDGVDGKPGKNGKDAPEINEEEIVKKVLARMPKPQEPAPQLVGSRSGRSGGGSTVRTDDLTSQCDGSNKTFTTNYKIGTPLILSGTQFPVILRPTTDYTVSNTTLTLTAAVGAPESGQTLIFVYVEG